eukprot:765232-Hanusia_phi.AAC.4
MEERHDGRQWPLQRISILTFQREYDYPTPTLPPQRFQPTRTLYDDRTSYIPTYQIMKILMCNPVLYQSKYPLAEWAHVSYPSF